MSNESICDDIRAAIASGEIQPHTRLVETDLMERFQAARPALRTALVRLEQEGLVEQQKNHSARVRLVERDEAIEIYQARALLESHAVALAAQRATADELRELDEVITRSELAGPLEVGRYETLFHQRILEISNDRTIRRLCGSLHGHLLRYHHLTKLNTEWSAESPCEHRHILEAMRAQDSAKASALMRAHLDRLTDILKRVLE